MKKKYFVLLPFVLLIAFSASVSSISENKMKGIAEKCSSIKDNLKNVQRADARTRVYLGGYYDIILNKFIIPLNIRLVENNLSTPELVENQNNFAETKTIFMNDFIKYQQTLEELVGQNCKNEPEKFYEELVVTRARRKTVEQDVLKMRELISEHIKLVNNLKGDL